eukprot:390289-Hanusia_phi.AAC.2
MARGEHAEEVHSSTLESDTRSSVADSTHNGRPGPAHSSALELTRSGGWAPGPLRHRASEEYGHAAAHRAERRRRGRTSQTQLEV